MENYSFPAVFKWKVKLIRRRRESFTCSFRIRCSDILNCEHDTAPCCLKLLKFIQIHFITQLFNNWFMTFSIWRKFSIKLEWSIISKERRPIYSSTFLAMLCKFTNLCPQIPELTVANFPVQCQRRLGALRTAPGTSSSLVHLCDSGCQKVSQDTAASFLETDLRNNFKTHACFRLKIQIWAKQEQKVERQRERGKCWQRFPSEKRIQSHEIPLVNFLRFARFQGEGGLAKKLVNKGHSRRGMQLRSERTELPRFPICRPFETWKERGFMRRFVSQVSKNSNDPGLSVVQDNTCSFPDKKAVWRLENFAKRGAKRHARRIGFGAFCCERSDVSGEGIQKINYFDFLEAHTSDVFTIAKCCSRLWKAESC